MPHRFLYVLLVLPVGLSDILAQDFYSNPEPKNQKLRVGVSVGGQANIVGFREARLWDARFRVRPYIAWNAGLTIQEPLSSRFYLNAGLSFIQLGLATAYVTTYTAGGRYAATSTGRSSHGLFALPISLQYNFRVRPKNRHYLLAGTTVYYNLEERSGFIFARSTIRDLNTKDVTTISQEKTIVNQWIPAITTGIGMEQQISRRSALTVELTGCVGLREITNTHISVSIVNPATLIKPINFSGNALNKGSFVGVKLGYLYGWK